MARGGRLVWRVWHVTESDGAWRRVKRVLVRQKLQSARGGTCEVFSGHFLVGFCSGLSILSLNAFSLTVG